MKKQPLLHKQCILPYADFIVEVNRYGWHHLSNSELKSQLLACDSFSFPLLYSLVKEVILRCTGLSLFDTQICAAWSIQQGRIAELPTGEGKTLAAVTAAACFALQKKRVHILTFNDYLAKRDCLQNTDIFSFCGLTTQYIHEQSNSEERKQAYSCDVVYVSAKQAGFDYLKNFLCTHTEDLLPVLSDVAIVDEADSILIDEARIPLVAAGNTSPFTCDAEKADLAVQTLPEDDIVFGKQKNEFWLTESGIAHAERFFRLDNLFNPSHAAILSQLYAAIEARYLLHIDKDYIVKDQQILLVDETTGRIAASRKLPALLHQAVEIKEGLEKSTETIIYNSIPLQFFLLHYPLLGGMTGTIKPSEKEIKSMYGLEVDIIPPHIPCIRKDYPDILYETETEKSEGILNQVEVCYRKGQPVLLGTQSVLESELYSGILTAKHIPHSLLNARNPEEEAVLIAEAGTSNKVTVSTNLAGRGVDIRLGGGDKRDEDLVKAAGGLFVIGCGLNRSPRIDRQLIGRAGRQGDPGESRFFISREDPLLVQYSSHSSYRLKALEKLIRHVQRREDCRDAEARYILEKYAYILEVQRRLITSWRTDLLLDVRSPNFLKEDDPKSFMRHVKSVGAEAVCLAEKQLTLHFINQHWADYLCTMEAIRSGIHLTIMGGLHPIDEYHRLAVTAFSEMEMDIKADVLSNMKTCTITAEGIDLESAGLLRASTTSTYLIDESKSQFAKVYFPAVSPN